jgi:hypothetical protein
MNQPGMLLFEEWKPPVSLKVSSVGPDVDAETLLGYASLTGTLKHHPKPL